MRAVIQRVLSARVEVEGRIVGEIGQGMLVLVGAGRASTLASAVQLADRVAGCRIFSDAEGKMNLALSALPEPGGVLAVSNFTLYGDALSGGRRPSFGAAAGFEDGQALFDGFVAELCKRVDKVETGQFGAEMRIHMEADGPVTLILEIEPPSA
jgi:D-tyrosyl-tRNA(Tyr) deacylase